MLAPSHLGCGYSHNCTGDMAITPTGDVAACRIARDALLPRNQARYDFCLKISNRAALCFGEAFHIGMSKLNVLFQLLWHQITSRLNFRVGQNQISIISVKFRCIFKRDRVTPRFDVIENFHDRCAHIIAARRGGFRRFFEIDPSHCQHP